MIYLLTAIEQPPGGSSTVHIYTQKQCRERHKTNNTYNNTKNLKECGPCPVFTGFYAGICLTTEGKARKNLSGFYSFFNLDARGGWVINATPRAVLSRERDPVPIVQEAGWAPGPVWTVVENLAPTAIRSSDCPACSESLYRLSYPGPP